MRTIKLSALLVTVLVLANACVDNDYDLKKINTEENVSIFKGVGFPVGSFEEFLIGDIVSIGNGVVKEDETGDYSLYYKGTGVNKSFSLDAVVIDAFASSDRISNLSVPVTDFSAFTDISLAFNEDYEYKVNNYDFPAEVQKIYEVAINGSASVDLSYTAGAAFPFSRIWIAKDTKFSLPDWLVIGEITDARFIRQNDNTLIVKEDLAVSATEKLNITVPLVGMDFSKLPEGQGLTASHTLLIDDWFKVSGNVKIKKADASSSVPGVYNISFNKKLKVSEISISSIDAEVAMKRTIEDQVSSIDELPVFLTDGTTQVDFADFRLYLDVNSDLPLVLKLKTDLATYSGEDKIAACTIGADDAPLLVPNGKKSYVFTEKGLGKEGISDYKLDKFNSLFIKVPSKIELSNLVVSNDPVRARINLGGTYNVGMDYWIDTPLIFGKNFSFSADQKLSGFNLDGGNVKFKTVVLKTDVVNTVPLAFDIKGEAIDAEGNVCSDLTVKVTGNVGQGSVDKPSKSPLSIDITTTGSFIVMDGIRLKLKASSPDEAFRNICLNSKQGIKFTSVSLELPDGIIISTKK